MRQHCHLITAIVHGSRKPLEIFNWCCQCVDSDLGPGHVATVNLVKLFATHSSPFCLSSPLRI